MFVTLPIEINYAILNSCTIVDIAIIGLINKECYTHILDPITSSTCFYNSAKKLSLFKLTLTTKLDQIFNKKRTYIRNRDILIEMDEFVQVGDFHRINKNNLDDFRDWLLKIKLEEIVDCIFVSDRIMIYDYSADNRRCNYDYCITDQNNKKIIVNNVSFYSAKMCSNQDSFYVERNIIIANSQYSANFAYQYFDQSDSFMLKSKLIRYIFSTNSPETRLANNKKHLQQCFWYLTDTAKYNIVAISTEINDNQTNIDLILVDKNILVSTVNNYNEIDIDLDILLKYSFQTSSSSHPKHIKVCHDNAESRLYVVVLGANKFELFVFDLDSKNFISSNIKIDCKYYVGDFDDRKLYPISLNVVDNRYLLITLLDSGTLFLYWINVRSSLIYLESIEKYKGGMVNAIKIDIHGILIQEYDGDYGCIYCFY